MPEKYDTLIAIQTTLKQTEDRYLEELNRLWPVGTVVEVRMGRATVRGPVLRWVTWPGHFRAVVMNEKTGKKREAWPELLMEGGN